MSPRNVEHQYQDPLEVVWRTVLRDIGWDLQWVEDAYASWDGKRTLRIARPAHWDADDSLAQLVLHEICHALVGGPGAQALPDWGLSNVDDRDLVYEHACHRLQAALADRYGLRQFLAVTTEYRGYWDALPVDPLRDGPDPAIRIAQEAYVRAHRPPFQRALREGLEATARLASIVRGMAEPESLWRNTVERHRTGFLQSAEPSLRCGACAWFAPTEQGRHHCLQSIRGGEPATEVVANELGCDRWEAVFEGEEACATCGACCREGYDLVPVEDGERFMQRHPRLVRVSTLGPHLPRPQGRCPMLEGDGSQAPFRCREYEDRPTACADFPVRGEACLLARRRVGLSR